MYFVELAQGLIGNEEARQSCLPLHGGHESELEFLGYDPAVLEESQSWSQNAARFHLPLGCVGATLRAKGRELGGVEHGLERELDALLAVKVRQARGIAGE